MHEAAQRAVSEPIDVAIEAKMSSARAARAAARSVSDVLTSLLLFGFDLLHKLIELRIRHHRQRLPARAIGGNEAHQKEASRQLSAPHRRILSRIMRATGHEE